MKNLTYFQIDDINGSLESILNYDKIASSLSNARDPSEWQNADGIVQARQGKKVIASIAWILENGHEDNGEEWGHLMDVSVHPEYRRRGLAKKIIHVVIGIMKSRNIWQYFLEVKTQNTEVINLYKKMGFDIEKILHDYYDDNVDAYLMTRTSRKIIRKKTLKLLKQKREIIPKVSHAVVNIGEISFFVYPVSLFGQRKWKWNIDYDNEGLIMCSEYEQFWHSARCAYLAGRCYLDTHREELCKEANDRKKNKFEELSLNDDNKLSFDHN